MDAIQKGTSDDSRLSRYRIAVVIPCYDVADHIDAVLRSLPAYVRHIIVVNDGSRDGTLRILEEWNRMDSRIVVLNNPRNVGVGGSVIAGYRKALELNAQIAVKIDGDGQMDIDELPRFLGPLIDGLADYTKGNRFHDFAALRQMPIARRAGNVAVSFLSKASTGYWNCFDPTNGYTAIRCDMLRLLQLSRLHSRYFFETSLLGELFLHDAFVVDISIPARYGSQRSHLSIGKVLVEYPFRLSVLLGRRILLKKFVYDFDVESMHLVCGIPLLLGGLLYGGYNWWYYLGKGVGAPAGTVVISALLIILGFQLVLAAIGVDIQKYPRKPLMGTVLGPGRIVSWRGRGRRRRDSQRKRRA